MQTTSAVLHFQLFVLSFFSVERGEFLLLPRVPQLALSLSKTQKQTEKVNSAMIVPVTGASGFVQRSDGQKV
jgi:hypothetical protein